MIVVNAKTLLAGINQLWVVKNNAPVLDHTRIAIKAAENQPLLIGGTNGREMNVVQVSAKVATDATFYFNPQNLKKFLRINKSENVSIDLGADKTMTVKGGKNTFTAKVALTGYHFNIPSGGTLVGEFNLSGTPHKAYSQVLFGGAATILTTDTKQFTMVVKKPLPEPLALPTDYFRKFDVGALYKLTDSRWYITDGANQWLVFTANPLDSPPAVAPIFENEVVATADGVLLTDVLAMGGDEVLLWIADNQVTIRVKTDRSETEYQLATKGASGQVVVKLPKILANFNKKPVDIQVLDLGRTHAVVFHHPSNMKTVVGALTR